MLSVFVSGTAIGTYGSGIQSHSDFISKTKNKENVVVFQQVNLNCDYMCLFVSSFHCNIVPSYFIVLWF